jgi:hypothetical protein
MEKEKGGYFIIFFLKYDRCKGDIIREKANIVEFFGLPFFVVIVGRFVVDRLPPQPAKYPGQSCGVHML